MKRDAREKKSPHVVFTKNVEKSVKLSVSREVESLSSLCSVVARVSPGILASAVRFRETRRSRENLPPKVPPPSPSLLILR